MNSTPLVNIIRRTSRFESIRVHLLAALLAIPSLSASPSPRFLMGTFLQELYFFAVEFSCGIADRADPFIHSANTPSPPRPAPFLNRSSKMEIINRGHLERAHFEDTIGFHYREILTRLVYCSLRVFLSRRAEVGGFSWKFWAGGIDEWLTKAGM